MDYQSFLSQKIPAFVPSGFECSDDLLNPNLKAFQRDIVKLALRLGKFANWANTGLGKGLMLLSWADAVCKETGGNVIILAPLGVSKQLVREAAKFSIETLVQYCTGQSQVKSGITITNYERLERFDASEFIGVVLDESSILKSETGAVCQSIINTFAQTPYKLSCSATPSPNDYMELGTQAEFLGVMSRVEMLAMFFTHDGGDTSKWRIKKHGKAKFWEWIATWAVMLRFPSDLGYSDAGYILPGLNVEELVVETEVEAQEGMLFAWEARTLLEQRSLNKSTMDDRVKAVSELVNGSTDQWVVWCETNDESKMIAGLIDGAVEVKGTDSPEHKEQAMMGFVDGSVRVLVSKSSICGFGMNFQNCHNCVFLESSHSFERVYQAIRRFYRFGQQHEVTVYFVRHQLEAAVQRNYQRKEQESDQMYAQLVQAMQKITMVSLGRTKNHRMEYTGTTIEIPSWLLSEVA
jgi:hypothetical protein